jgi:hypothetical protein
MGDEMGGEVSYGTGEWDHEKELKSGFEMRFL